MISPEGPLRECGITGSYIQSKAKISETEIPDFMEPRGLVVLMFQDGEILNVGSRLTAH